MRSRTGRAKSTRRCDYKWMRRGVPATARSRRHRAQGGRDSWRVSRLGYAGSAKAWSGLGRGAPGNDHNRARRARVCRLDRSFGRRPLFADHFLEPLLQVRAERRRVLESLVCNSEHFGTSVTETAVCERAINATRVRRVCGKIRTVGNICRSAFPPSLRRFRNQSVCFRTERARPAE